MGQLILQPAAAAGLDTMLNSIAASQGYNYGVATTVRVGTATANQQRRMLLAFDISSLPAGATITAATLTLNCTSEDSATDRNVGVHRALTQWYEGIRNAATPNEDGSTWDYRNWNGSVAWGAEGGLADTDYTAAATATTSITGTGDHTWGVLADVQAWYAGTATNYGWFIINTAEATESSGKIFATSDNSTASSRPELVIDYTCLTDQAVSGGLSYSGALVKHSIVFAVGSLTSAGVLTAVRRYFRAFTGAITSSGALVNRTGKTLAGAITGSGVLVNRTARALSGAVTSSGALVQRTGKVLAGAITGSGVLVNRTGKGLSGALVSAGGLVRGAGKVISGSLGSSGTLINRVGKVLAGALNSAGELISVFLPGAGVYLQELAGDMILAGNIVKWVARNVVGSIASAGGLVIRSSKVLTGIMTISGVVSKSISKILAGVLAAVGTLIAHLVGEADRTPDIRTYMVATDENSFQVPGGEGENRPGGQEYNADVGGS